MSAVTLVEWVSIAELVLLTGLLLLMWKRRALREFPMLSAFIGTRCLYGAITTPAIFFHYEIGISKFTAYHILFYSYWPSCILQAILMVLLVYGIYNMALAPFGPLKKLGAIIFRWIAAISVAVSLGVALGPHVLGRVQLANLVGQMQQTASILTLCLLLYDCFALKPLRLSTSVPSSTSIADSAHVPRCWYGPAISLSRSPNAAWCCCRPRLRTSSGTRSPKRWAIRRALSRSAASLRNRWRPASLQQ
jgi:hypothetical protein